MTCRLTCFFVFTLLLLSPVNVSGQNAVNPVTPGPPVAATVATAATAPANVPAPSTSATCPSGDASNNDECQWGCETDGICYRDLKLNGADKRACCKKLNQACPSTKMFQKHAPGNNAQDYLFGFDNKMDNSTWYKRQFTAASPNGVACPIPNSFTLVDFTVPDEWKNEGQTKSEEDDKDYKLKSCEKNNDCEENEFCDAVYNPSFDDDKLDKSGAGGKSLRFCYPLPTLESSELFDGQELKHVEHEKGLKICNSHRDCKDSVEFCHITGRKYRNESNAKGINIQGICVQVDACLKSDQTVGAVLNVNSQFCVDDLSCEGAGVSKDNQDYDPHCRSYWKSDPSRKGCCFEKTAACRVGKAVTPQKKCTKMTDCTGEVPKNAWNTWCDDGGKNICCKDKENRAWQCPDLATPLFNEPKCSGVVPGKDSSGKCPKPGSRCHFEHCCPSLTITENGTKITLGKNLYKTEFPCDPNTAVPNHFTYAFCNPEEKKLVIIGKFHDNGDQMTKISGKKCTINADCSSDASSICVYENSASHICYYNPLRPLRPSVSMFWKTVLIVSLVCGAIFMVLSLICFVCYRSKSVFDKYKKKGKKGSKSSKGSKSKKGKKGKKGKGKGSGSSTNSKKKSSKKETEKSETGASTGESSSQIN